MQQKCGAKDTALEPLATKRLQGKLRPVFETDVERTTLPVCAGESTIEIALDRGRIKAGQQREPISEVEIELKHGDPSELTRIAERLAASLPVAYHPRPKQDRGYALLTEQRPALFARLRSCSARNVRQPRHSG